jgi:hypothetical protein
MPLSLLSLEARYRHCFVTGLSHRVGDQPRLAISRLSNEPGQQPDIGRLVGNGWLGYFPGIDWPAIAEIGIGFLRRFTNRG